jgi:hypothetical protein
MVASWVSCQFPWNRDASPHLSLPFPFVGLLSGTQSMTLSRLRPSSRTQSLTPKYLVVTGPMYREFPQNHFKHYMDNCLVATADGELNLYREMNHRLLNIFEEHSYFLKPFKFIFEQPEVDFLRVWLGHSQITIDLSKIAGIKDWPQILKTVKEVRSTLGVLGFQCPFIPEFTDITKPLTSLLKKNLKFKWTEDCTMALKTLINIVTSEPVLVSPDTIR